MKVLKVKSLLSRGNGLEEKVYKVKGFKAWSWNVEFHAFYQKNWAGIWTNQSFARRFTQGRMPKLRIERRINSNLDYSVYKIEFRVPK